MGRDELLSEETRNLTSLKKQRLSRLPAALVALWVASLSPPGLATSTWPWLFPPWFCLLLFFFCSSSKAQSQGHGTAAITLHTVPARGHQHSSPAHGGDSNITSGWCGMSFPAKGRAHLLPAHGSHPQGHQTRVMLARTLHLQKRMLTDNEAPLAGCRTREHSIPCVLVCLSPCWSSAVWVSLHLLE